MPTQNVNLSPEQSAFIQSAVKNGQFCNASEVVRAGLRALEVQMQEQQLKLERLRNLVQEGVQDIEKGHFVALGPSEISDYLKKL